MISEMMSIPFINACIGLDIKGDKAEVVREVDGGKETISSSLPLIIGGQKGLVNENDLLIPNMRGIMQSRTKPLEVIEPHESEERVSSISFNKPEKKDECKLINDQDVSVLVDLLQNEAKVI